MSLKLVAVRMPETMHTYLKCKAAVEKTTIQELFNTILSEYQAKDEQYQAQLKQAVTDSLNALAELTEKEQEVSHGV